jgi:hypothetical protein
MLQDSVEYAILMPHGVDPLPCPETLPDVRKIEESTPCALSTKTQPDSRGLELAIHAEPQHLRNCRVVARVKPAHDEVVRLDLPVRPRKRGPRNTKASNLLTAKEKEIGRAIAHYFIVLSGPD